jgi:hypothetical protein
MRIAFYVEPVVFRQNPLFLQPWVEWVSTIARANAESASVALVSSPWLCNLLSDRRVERRLLVPAEVLRPFSMDRIAYGEDLAAPLDAPVVNGPLRAALLRAIDEWKPDAIVSFTQNRYLSDGSLGVPTFFTELQPLPRIGGRSGFFLDWQGAGSHSILATDAPRILAAEPGPVAIAAAMAAWDAYLNDRLSRDHEAMDMRGWLRARTRGERIAMIALQPPDWLTMEPVSGRTPLDGVLMDWLDRLPEGWRAIVTYHPSYALPQEAEDAIAAQMPKLLQLPPSWRQGRSELLLRAVDAVVTVSSTLGFTSLVAGIPTFALGRSALMGIASTNIGALGQGRPLSVHQRQRLLAFLLEHYCHPAERFLHEPGYLPAKLAALSERERGDREAA